jgi:hypothetical protein
MEKFKALDEFTVPQLKKIVDFLEEQTGFTDSFASKAYPNEANRFDFYEAIHNLITYSK